jgi:hypothetical protein
MFHFRNGIDAVRDCCFRNPNPPRSSALSIPTNSPSPTESNLHPSQCGIRNPDLAFVLPPDTIDIPAKIAAYLNAGGDPLNIGATGDGLLAPDFLVEIRDLNQDMNNEVVVAGPFFSPGSLERTASLTIYSCEQSSFRTTYSEYVEDATSGFFLDQFDFPPERGNDIVFVSHSLHGGRTEYLIVVWNGMHFATALDDATDSPSQIAVYDRDDDGLLEVNLIAPTHNSVSGGPNRDEVRRYEWLGSTYERQYTTYLPSTSRVHLLQDAQLALEENDIARAIGIYRVAAEDRSYTSAPTGYERTNGLEGMAEDYQRSFAAFRAAVLLYNVRCIPCADGIERYMQNEFPQGAPGGELLEAFQIFKSEFETGATLAHSCQAAETFLAEKYPHVAGETGHLGSWGWANLEFGISDMCP